MITGAAAAYRLLIDVFKFNCSYQSFVFRYFYRCCEFATYWASMCLRTPWRRIIAVLLLFCCRPNRPHYGSCSSIRLSVCPARAPSSNTRKKLAWRTGVIGVPIFSSKNQRSGGRPHNLSALGQHSFLVVMLWHPSITKRFVVFFV